MCIGLSNHHICGPFASQLWLPLDCVQAGINLHEILASDTCRDLIAQALSADFSLAYTHAIYIADSCITFIKLCCIVKLVPVLSR